MFRKSFFLIFVFFVCINFVSAVNSWNNSTGNNDYREPQNWSKGSVPEPFGTSGTEDVYIALDSPDHAVAGSGTSGGNNVYIGINGNGRVEISDCTFKTRFIRLGYSSDGVLIANNAIIEQDIASGTGRYMDAGCSSGTTGYLELNGTSQFLTGISKLGLGVASGSTGTAVFNDDTVVESLYVHLGDNGDGSLTINDNATYNVSNTIWLPQGGGTGHLQLNSGVVTASGLMMRHNGGVGTIDIELGRLILDGDDTAAVGPYVTNGWITAYGGDDDVDVYYDGTRTIIQAYSNSENFGISTTPSPANGYDDMPINLIFRWQLFQPGTRNFYIGTSYSAVANADTSSYEFKGSTTNNYFVTPLEFSETYFWRVEYVDASGSYESDIWSFSTEGPSDFTADGFESYLSDSELKNNWQDGSANGTGSSITLETSTGNRTYKGQSLKLAFDNTASPYKSEIIKNYSTGQNWSVGNVKALTLKYLGDPNAEGFYVGVFDGSSWSIQRIDDKDIIAAEKWKELNFALADFAGISLNNVRAVKIGLSNMAVSPGYNGTVYIDEIRVNKSRCVKQFGPEADFDGDCDVDFDDFILLSDLWMVSDYYVNQSEPGSDSLLVHYDFESSSGSTVYDNSGNFYHATVDANGTDGWEANGYAGGCMNFDGTFGITLPNAVFGNINEEITVSAWINIDANQASGKYEAVSAGAGYKPITGEDYYWEGGSIKLEEVSDYWGRWNHYAFVVDSGTIGIYKNAELISAQSVGNINIANFGITRIGSDNSNLSDIFIGKLDEFKIFSNALNHNEIAYLANISLNQPLLDVIAPVDPHPDGIINLLDLAVMAEAWYEVILWP